MEQSMHFHKRVRHLSINPLSSFTIWKDIWGGFEIDKGRPCSPSQALDPPKGGQWTQGVLSSVHSLSHNLTHRPYGLQHAASLSTTNSRVAALWHT